MNELTKIICILSQKEVIIICIITLYSLIQKRGNNYFPLNFSNSPLKKR